MRDKKSITVIFCTGLLIFGFALTALFRETDAYSDSERRALAQMPEITKERLLSGKFMSDFEDYALDQFPFRDGFRKLKAVTMKYALGQRDNHGIYMVKGYVSKLDYPVNEKALDQNIAKFVDIRERYLKDSDCKVYFSVIPDKNYFLAAQDGYPVMDYDALVQKMQTGMGFAEYLDIFSELSLEDYYYTDQHWRQERIQGVVQKLAQGMQVSLKDSYREKILDVPFYGAYVGQSALSAEPDRIHYLTSDLMEKCMVTSYDSGSAKPGFLYDMEKAEGKDPYEMFLSGADALLTIENPDAETDRELILFRDSFGSSLAPLLISGYGKITLVDLRYIRNDLVGKFTEFQNADVLFLYSTLVLNHG